MLSALRFSDPWLVWEPVACTTFQAACQIAICAACHAQGAYQGCMTSQSIMPGTCVAVFCGRDCSGCLRIRAMQAFTASLSFSNSRGSASESNICSVEAMSEALLSCYAC